MKFPLRMQDISRDSGGASMAGTSQLWEPPQEHTSTSTLQALLPPPPSEHKANKKQNPGISKTVTDSRARCRRRCCDSMPPEVPVLTSPLSFSADACLSTLCRPGRLCRLRLALLLLVSDVRGELIADIGNRLSKPAYMVEMSLVQSKSELGARILR